MKQVYFKIADNRLIAKDIYKMTLVGDTGGISAGQFVNVALDGLYLRRPLSVCDVNGNELTLIYKTVGVGTAKMSGYGSGVVLDVLTGLGNGYDLTVPHKNPLLIGGGVGVPPLYLAAKELIKRGKTVTAILGFNTENEAFYLKEFALLGVKTLITTVDGTMGIKGFVTNALKLVDTYD
ncbi:MAG: dihydroorotate dehydrogenase electron transfer subunit, partial [Clostridia bacterium]|nr:dihydroorotate dehydrogenase electron transfer subunit [Clostridia bacterium]